MVIKGYQSSKRKSVKSGADLTYIVITMLMFLGSRQWLLTVNKVYERKFSLFTYIVITMLMIGSTFPEFIAATKNSLSFLYRET